MNTCEGEGRVARFSMSFGQSTHNLKAYEDVSGNKNNTVIRVVYFVVVLYIK